MQNRYTADIGDFGKFLLLRYLFNHTGYKLKQVWYLYPDESHNSDGLHTNYFEKVKNQDIFLEEQFKYILKHDLRSVKTLEECELIHCDYFGEFVTQNKESLVFRKAWLDRAIDFIEKTDYTFVDPDNGIATQLIKNEDTKDIKLLDFNSFSQKSKAGKYIFMDEIKAYYERSRCVIVYHHLNRTMSHDTQIKILQSKLSEGFFKVLAIKHKPYSPRVYFFILKDKYIHYFVKTNLKKFQEKFSIHWEFFE